MVKNKNWKDELWLIINKFSLSKNKETAVADKPEQNNNLVEIRLKTIIEMLLMLADFEHENGWIALFEYHAHNFPYPEYFVYEEANKREKCYRELAAELKKELK